MYLPNDNKLTHLDLSDNLLDPPQVRLLAFSLKGHPTLQILNLNRNFAGEALIDLADQYLQDNQTLTHLKISDNRITLEGAQSLGLYLKKSSILTLLNISSNDLQPTGIIPILEALHFNRSLRSLNISKNFLEEDIIPYVESVLSRNITLEKLYFERMNWLNRMSYLGMNENIFAGLAHVLRTNSTLTELKFYGLKYLNETDKLIQKLVNTNKTFQNNKRLFLKWPKIHHQLSRQLKKKIVSILLAVGKYSMPKDMKVAIIQQYLHIDNLFHYPQRKEALLKIPAIDE
eukprot:TRINITY_DN3901_c0_g1_i1.p1 TRINITY_DN3901_c0_g1~~TRINITY_DN3901_c0_g1_i1.p1  ORF type:complete len:288 (+),score=49.99 TRINITY_DN3901_c0_g1_i1:168-1031(+)